MSSLVMGLVFLTFGVIIIAILRRLAFAHSLRPFLQNPFFWLSLLALSALLCYAALAPLPMVQAQPPNTATTAETQTPDLPLPPSDTPPPVNTWLDLTADLAATYPDPDLAIYAEDLNNPARVVNVNADRPLPLASVYKLAVAYSMLHAIATETAAWDTPLWNTTLENCFDLMIINSNNECAHAWGDSHGWDTITQEFAELDLTINLYEPTTATAKTIADFLKKLYHSEILNDELTEKFLTALQSQVYRQGIPADLPTDTVAANKVGFMNGVLNDAALVLSPKGDYVLVILTQNQSWQTIAAIAARIHENY